jgi:hypothetical protein
VFGPATLADAQAAQILTGACMALFLAAGFISGPARKKIQAGVLVAYLLGCAAFIVHVLAR